MSNLNRIKCDAAIDAYGVIVVGEAKPGCLAPPDLWVDGGAMTTGKDGSYAYLLESGAGAWEIGCLQVSYGGATRVVLQSSDGAFANSTTGLTFSLIVSADGMWSANRLAPTDATPSAWGNSMAAGANAKVAVRVSDAIAVGDTAHANGDGAIAIGKSTTCETDGVALGRSAVAHNCGVALGSGAEVNAVTSLFGGVAIGHRALSSGEGAIALGARAAPSGEYSIAVGRGTQTANLHSIAIGHLASVQGAGGGGVALGAGATVTGDATTAGIAIGYATRSVHDSEVVIGAAVRGRTRMIPISWGDGGSALSHSGTEFLDASANYAIALGAIDNYVGTRANGVMRITGTIVIEDKAHVGNTAYLKVFSIDYLAWVVVATSSVTVLGTPTVTALFTGASAPNSTLAISTGGVPKITSTYTGMLDARGMMNIDDLQTTLDVSAPSITLY